MLRLFNDRYQPFGMVKCLFTASTGTKMSETFYGKEMFTGKK